MRELHDNLSEYLRAVAEGREVVVTSRGRRVARIVPFASTDPLAELRARGLVRDPVGPKRSAGRHTSVTASGPVAELVHEQRR